MLEVVLAEVGLGELAALAAELDFGADVLADAGAFAGAELAAGVAISLVAFLLLLLFFADEVVEPSAAAPVSPAASADAGDVVPASPADFFLLVFLELPVSVVADFPPSAVTSELSLLLLFLVVAEVSEPAACSPAAMSDDFFELFLEVAPPELSAPESADLAFLDDVFVVSRDSAD
jgi:hypothetical protein